MVGEIAVPTGFARIADSLLPRLQAAFDVHQLCLWTGATLPLPPWPAVFRRVDSPLSAQFEELLGELRPDLVLVIHDLRTVGALGDALAAGAGGFRSVSYCPLDAARPKSALVQALRRVDVAVAFTETQARAVREALGEGAGPRRMEVLPLGVDTDRFRPLWRDAPAGERARARERVLGGRCSGDAFVVLNANRNHVRKRIDLTVEGFALFARSRPDAVLCLHSGAADPMGWDLRALAGRYSVEDRVVFTAPGAPLPDAADDRLNLIFNLCDVGLNTSVGEGWGLTSFEHAATGAAQVVPGHTACGELWRSHGVLVPATEPIPTVDPHRDEQRVHADDVADALARLYDDRVALRRCSEAAYLHATGQRYSWARIAERWAALLEELAASR